MPDVFPTGGPVGPHDIVDRSEFIDDLATRLGARHSCVVAAPRRQGKTSVAHEALRRLRGAGGTQTVAVDVARVSTVEELAERLTVACLANLTPVARGLGAVRGSLPKLLRAPEVRAKIHDYELALAFPARDTMKPSGEELLDQALDLPEQIAARDDALCVVLFDEFQALSAVGGARIMARMRSAFQLQTHTAFLFLGSHAGMMSQLFGSPSQPFFRFATMLDLPPVPTPAWRTYLLARFAELGMRADPAALDLILEHTGGHPYDTMEAAFEAYMLGRRVGVVDSDLAAAACQAAQARLFTVFEAEIDALGPAARATLGRLAKGEALHPRGTSRATSTRALTFLQRSGVIRHDGHGRYAFVEPMLAHHLES